MHRSTRALGFTIIELLVVISILVLLISLLLPALSSVREVMRTSMCLTNMRSITLASTNYANDHNGKMPSRYHTSAPRTFHGAQLNAGGYLDVPYYAAAEDVALERRNVYVCPATTDFRFGWHRMSSPYHPDSMKTIANLAHHNRDTSQPQVYYMFAYGVNGWGGPFPVDNFGGSRRNRDVAVPAATVWYYDSTAPDHFTGDSEVGAARHVWRTSTNLSFFDGSTRTVHREDEWTPVDYDGIANGMTWRRNPGGN